MPVKDKVDNYLQAIVYFLALVYAVLVIVNTVTNGCCAGGTWHVGLSTIIFGWIYFIYLISKLPIIGEHAIVFLDIFWTFFKLALFALLLVLAATIVLQMTFYNAQAQVGSLYKLSLVTCYIPTPCYDVLFPQNSPFITFGRGIITVLTMITGGLDYSSIFNLSYDTINNTITSTSIEEDNQAIPYPGAANFVWVIFLVLIPILLSNMLVSNTVLANRYKLN